MMNRRSQRGSVLLVAMFILTLLLMIGASALSGSMVELRVSGITKRSIDGFQKAEAGISGTFALIGTPDDPFEDGKSTDNVFAGVQDSPIANVNDVTVTSELTQSEVSCIRNRKGFTASKVVCDYYELRSVHNEPNTNIETQVVQGLRKEVLAN